MYFCIIIKKDLTQAMLERIIWHLFSNFIFERGFYCVSLTSLDLRALPASASCFQSTGTEGALQAHSGLQTQHRATRLVQPFDSKGKKNS